ncbi:MAG: thiol reductant ABC exporter subunit CydD [Anaerolineae bacterium]|nr:thiol reductant ABC exporter subunit CydD [Anaerolineae bacterium]
MDDSPRLQVTTVNRRLVQQTRLAQFDFLLTVILNLLGGILLVGQAYYLSQVINRVFLEQHTLAEVQSLLLMFFGLSLLRAAFTWGSEVTAQRLAGQVKNNLRNRLTAHLLALGPTYAHGERSGELANTAVEGIESLDAYFSQYLPQLAVAALVPLTILAVVFPLDLTTGLVLLFTAPLIPIFMILIGNLADKMTRRQWTTLSRMSAHFLDVLQGLTTLKILGRSREQAETIRRLSYRLGQTTMSVLRVAFLSALVLEWVATLSTAIVAVEIGLRLLYGRLIFADALFILILAPEFYLPLRMLGARFHAGMAGLAAANRIFEILDTPLPIAIKDRSGFKKLTGLLPSSFSIQFSHVHYAYDDGLRPALNGVSLTIAPGQKIALVGPSGAGKSTVAHLLLRFIDPQQGSITVNGAPLSALDLSGWRAQLAWVPQQPHLFYGTIAENIRLARPEASLAEVIQAAQLASATSFIETLPQGYDTLIGERGLRLSGGQAQRLALARVFLKNAPFLILDEATANLDPEHERQIQAAIERLLQGRTVLIIAHRLNTVVNADQILVMDKGKIVESGAHHALVSGGGLYHRLVAAYGGISEHQR